jgi:hypothetical protein
MLAGRTRPDWQPEMITTVQTKLSANAGQLIPAIDRVLNYVHQRTLQRFTLEAIRRAQDNGVAVDLESS